VPGYHTDMAASPTPKLTPAEYLALDRASDVRYEYADGLAVAMSGGTGAHSFLILAAGRELSIALRARSCNVGVASLRLQVDDGAAYFYPDVMVLCGPIRYADDTRDTVLNPTVVVEVLSGSTERWDRTGKFAKYRAVPSIREYVLVSQNEMLIEWYTRRENGEWVYRTATGPDGVCRLESLEIDLSLAEIYRGIDLA